MRQQLQHQVVVGLCSALLVLQLHAALAVLGHVIQSTINVAECCMTAHAAAHTRRFQPILAAGVLVALSHGSRCCCCCVCCGVVCPGLQAHAAPDVV
jgi:hypothetical protein